MNESPEAPGVTGDKRHFRRVRFGGKATISGVQGCSEVLDLSLKGVLLATARGWVPRVGDAHEVSIALEGCEQPIRMEADVAHVEEGRAGMCCIRIDLDSIRVLRRLVELNLADPRELERELAELGG